MNDERTTTQIGKGAWPSLEPVTLADGSGAWRYLFDADGDGIAVARSARPSFDTIHAQIAAFEALHARGRRIRELVITVGVDGHRRFHERPDLVAVERAVLAKPSWCSFVAFTEITRVSRSLEGTTLFWDFLDENHVELVLLDQGDGPASKAKAHLWLLPSIMAAAEREQMIARMRAGKLARRRAG